VSSGEACQAGGIDRSVACRRCRRACRCDGWAAPIPQRIFPTVDLTVVAERARGSVSCRSSMTCVQCGSRIQYRSGLGVGPRGTRSFHTRPVFASVTAASRMSTLRRSHRRRPLTAPRTVREPVATSSAKVAMVTLPGTPILSRQGLHQLTTSVSRASGRGVPASVPMKRAAQTAKLVEDRPLSPEAPVFASSQPEVTSSRRNLLDRQLLVRRILTGPR
jgi:hypothetical protein